MVKKRLRHRIVFGLLRPFGRIFYRLKYGLTAVKFKYTAAKPPFIILSNHVSLTDCLPLALSFPCNQIYYIASDIIFDRTFKSRAMQWLVSPISITKGAPDPGTVKDIFSVRNQGGIVGLFPSGNTTYSGKDTLAGLATAKLVRRLDVPVLLYRFDGLYGVNPRWGGGARRGRCMGAVRRVLMPDETYALSDEDLLALINDTLSTPPENFALSKYKSRRRAEYLERALFVCPHCLAENALSTAKAFISCARCGSKWEYTDRLTFEGEHARHIRTVRDWFDFQIDYIKTKDFQSASRAIYADGGQRLYKKPKMKNKQLVASGEQRIFADRLEIGGARFDISGITSVCVQSRNKLLFYHGDEMYIVEGGKRTNQYKYMAAAVMLNEKLKEKSNELLGL